MRLFWRVFFILVIAMTIGFNWQFLASLNSFSVKNSDATKQSSFIENSRVNLTYQLESENWLTFNLMGFDKEIKVVSNAELPLGVSMTTEDRWLYSIEYQVLDDDNRLLFEGQISQKTGQKIFIDELTQIQYVSSSYYPATLNPLDSRLYMINLRGFNNPTKLRLRMQSLQSPLVGVIARVYHRVPVATSKLDYQWQRMGIEKKNNLAKASVYQSQLQLLREEEKKLLMNNLWTPMGPLGINDRDYKTKKLYVKREVEQDSIINLKAVDPSGLMVYPDKFGVVKIPVFSGKVKLTWQSIEPASDNDTVNIEWWGHPSTRHKQWQIKTQSEVFTEQLDSGVLQLSATSTTVFKIWIEGVNQDTSDELVEITPDTANLRLYQIDQSPIIYRVNHINEQSTPLRIQLRSFVDEGINEASYAFYNKDNQLISKGLLNATAEKSNYDTVRAEPTRAIGDPLNYYFNLAANIDRLELTASKNVWGAVYTRPLNLPLLVSYPFKQENATESHKTVPAWYFLRPENWKSYVAAGRSLLLALQPRPPEIDEMLMAGQYRWEQFLASGNWRGRELLTRQYDDSGSSDLSATSQYLQIQPDKIIELEFIGQSNQSTISPNLLYLQQQESELKITLWLDNKIYFKQTVFAKSGELDLPTLAPGRYKIKLEMSKTAELFIDHIANSGDSFVKRLAINLDKKPLIFSYTKEYDEELLAIRVYTTKSQDLSQNIRLQLSPVSERKMGPLQSWSIVDREYQLDASDGLPAKLLGGVERELAAPRILFVALGEDLSNGKTYQIKLNLNSGPEGYVILSRTLPGIFDRRVIQYEKTIQ